MNLSDLDARRLLMSSWPVQEDLSVGQVQATQALAWMLSNYGQAFGEGMNNWGMIPCLDTAPPDGCRTVQVGRSSITLRTYPTTGAGVPDMVAAFRATPGLWAALEGADALAVARAIRADASPAEQEALADKIETAAGRIARALQEPLEVTRGRAAPSAAPARAPTPLELHERSSPWWGKYLTMAVVGAVGLGVVTLAEKKAMTFYSPAYALAVQQVSASPGTLAGDLPLRPQGTTAITDPAPVQAPAPTQGEKDAWVKGLFFGVALGAAGVVVGRALLGGKK